MCHDVVVVGMTRRPFFISSTWTRFILVGTQHNENVGATARAMKTMGFQDLVLISPRDPKVLTRHKVKQMASGALDVLHNAKIYASLREAIGDRNVICGTGMMSISSNNTSRNCLPRHTILEPRIFFHELWQSGRLFHPCCIIPAQPSETKYCWDVMTCASIPPRIRANTPASITTNDDEEDHGASIRLALIFGSEQTGLSETDIAQCNVMLSIPTNPSFGSLNVAAAVQLLAYDWRMTIGWGEDNKYR